ncbi:hypothetical protein K458DRAFT_412490 [Lentithecium fluviatile CBS 122367]|uniref:Uncharacterized protein n=1 Tax=Lentithecium fluviatile CBS 122367 TaxID=1168545 RepID=A0A6G1JL14_9PLEO|nr:hypothetical protein K458DRAFT_412490 [Lentithecium fluviatile CBS 122367]
MPSRCPYWLRRASYPCSARTAWDPTEPTTHFEHQNSLRYLRQLILRERRPLRPVSLTPQCLFAPVPSQLRLDCLSTTSLRVYLRTVHRRGNSSGKSSRAAWRHPSATGTILYAVLCGHNPRLAATNKGMRLPSQAMTQPCSGSRSIAIAALKLDAASRNAR